MFWHSAAALPSSTPCNRPCWSRCFQNDGEKKRRKCHDRTESDPTGGFEERDRCLTWAGTTHNPFWWLTVRRWPWLTTVTRAEPESCGLELFFHTPPEQKGIGILVHVLRVWGEPEAPEEPCVWHPVHQPFRGQEPGLLLSAREDRALRAGFQLCHSLFTLAHRGQVVLTWLIFSFAEVWREAGKDTATVKCTASFLRVTNTQNFLSDLDNTDNFQQENKQIPWKCSLIGIYILLDDSFEKWKLLLL